MLCFHYCQGNTLESTSTAQCKYVFFFFSTLVTESLAFVLQSQQNVFKVITWQDKWKVEFISLMIIYQIKSVFIQKYKAYDKK